MILTLSAAWHGHTDESRELARDISAALAACDLSEKAAAITMGIHPTDFSRQLAGRDPLSIWRLSALPADFWLALVGKRAARIGGALLTPEQLTLLRGAAVMGPSRMKKMVLPNEQDERRRA